MNSYTVRKIATQFVFGGIVTIGSFVAFNTPADAATVCTFDRDLQMGVVGEDVKCLQQYLNANGFVITTTGGGSPGKETTEFKTLTEAALIKWQKANKLSPASGYFGPRSQAVYKSLVSDVTVVKPVASSSLATGVDISPEALVNKVNELKAQLLGNITTPNTTKSSPLTTSTSSVAKQLKASTKSLRDAENEVADNADADDYNDALDSLADARTDFYSAVLAYLAGDASKAKNALDDVENSIADALNAIGS